MGWTSDDRLQLPQKLQLPRSSLLQSLQLRTAKLASNHQYANLMPYLQQVDGPLFPWQLWTAQSGSMLVSRSGTYTATSASASGQPCSMSLTNQLVNESAKRLEIYTTCSICSMSEPPVQGSEVCRTLKQCSLMLSSKHWHDLLMWPNALSQQSSWWYTEVCMQ